jgi:formylglycine-generating enzyme required for sulfatase activity
MKKNTFLLGVVAMLVANAVLAESSIPYQRGTDWVATMLSARSSVEHWDTVQEEALQIEAGSWHTTGPLGSEHFREKLFPEQGIALEAKHANGKPQWLRQPTWHDGALVTLPGGKNTATYLYRTIQAQKAMDFVAHIGSANAVVVWLNGERLLREDGSRPFEAGSIKLPINLKQGENKLLIKLFNRGGAPSFCFSVNEDPARALWSAIQGDFPQEAAWFLRDLPRNDGPPWFHGGDLVVLERGAAKKALKEAGDYGVALADDLKTLGDAEADWRDRRWLELYLRAAYCREGARRLNSVDFEALERAIDDLSERFPDAYPDMEFREQLAVWRSETEALKEKVRKGKNEEKAIQNLLGFEREVLLAHPDIDFEELLLVRRSQNNLGLPQNWQGNCSMNSRNFDNALSSLKLSALDAPLETIYQPEGNAFIGDVDLHFDGERALFSMPGSHNRWQIWEMDLASLERQQLTSTEMPDVDNYDPVYLPDERVIFGSTRCFQGVPCVGGSDTVANLYLMNRDSGDVRQLCFDQDHNWCPTVLNNGRILFTRWEYSDTPHYFSRLLFNMNPDGTGQTAYYGSNSYWPNSMFYARPLPNHPTKVVAVVSGHHGVARMGELVIFDPAQGRAEADGVVQRIPGYEKEVEPVIMDQLVNNSWPRFLHPYPIDDKFFLVSAQPSPLDSWGLYLVDVFDNMTLLKEMPGQALLEPIPWKKSKRPPVIADKVDLTKKDAVAYISNVYSGPGLQGVPSGTVKSLRLFAFHYSYPNMGGHINVGVEGAWDVHRILGTVPVYADGSASFRIPANTPIAVQPLDEQGRAVQLMRSWFTAMPGENISCIGCHEDQNTTPPVGMTIASQQQPSEITLWRGPARGFSFRNEVQPVLDANCVECHDGEDALDLRAKDEPGWNGFTSSYLALHPFVRRPGPESDYHLLKPMEFHASTSELVQMLEKGHHGVQLNEEAWDRLVTWIDLNVPDLGTWGEDADIPKNFCERRAEMLADFAYREEDLEAVAEVAVLQPSPRVPVTAPARIQLAGWPLDTAEGANLPRKTVDLGEGVSLELVQIPAGEFLMGSATGSPNEAPQSVVTIEKPFWMATTEITNAQFQRFNAEHFNGYIDQNNKDHTRPGYSIDAPDFPAVRLSWQEANEFCLWLSQKTGLQFDLPTEAQWEWACRAGSDTPMHFGGLDADFSSYANLADLSTKKLAVAGIDPSPIANPGPHEDWLPKEVRWDDGERLMCATGQYKANPWGLQDMHGNAAEWTKSPYTDYPYGEENLSVSGGLRVARGGSWRDRPKNATAAHRTGYEAWQKVYNVGFRLVGAIDTTRVAQNTK